MGFVFTVVYIILTIISPEQFGHVFASYRPLLYLAGVTAFTSLPAILTQSNLKSSIQTHLLIGFIIAIGLSQVANRWFGGAIQSWLAFIPSAAVFFFIVANANTIRKLKIVTLAVVTSCLVLVGEALYGYYGGFLGDTFVLNMSYSNNQVAEQILRVRGVGFLNDPNDFAQILLIALPLLFIAWRHGRILANFLFVLAPAALLLWGTYLTHSRGALIGLAVLGLVAARKRLGTTASLALTFVLVIGMVALDFSGGRGISASEGADRMSAWATGLELFKNAPLFGIGFGRFTEFNDITAHNSFVLCLAELGLLGTTLWLALLVTTTMGLNSLIALREEATMTDGGHKGVSDLPVGEDNAETVSDSVFDADQIEPSEDQPLDSGHELPGEGNLVEVARIEGQYSIGNVEHARHDAASEVSPFSAEWLPMTETASVSDATTQIDIESVRELSVPNNWMVVIRLALISFVATSWFLSRTYETPMYLVLGLAAAAIALDRSATENRNLGRWVPVTLAVEAITIIFIYFIVRLRH
jgi:putative inorganic carbon (hco3(-)) transporter